MTYFSKPLLGIAMVLAFAAQPALAEKKDKTVAFALDNRAITCTTLLVDGGQHLMKFDRDFSLMTPPPAQALP